MGFEIINKLKKDKGLTNAQLAVLSGVTLSTLDKITSGINTNPKLNTLQAICRVLGCTLDDFDDNPDNGNVYVLPKTENMPLDAAERELIKKYRDLDDRGKDLVMCIIDRENAYLDEEVDTYAIADTGQQKSTKITRRKAIEAKKQWLLMKDDAYDDLRRALKGEFAPKEEPKPDDSETTE